MAEEDHEAVEIRTPIKDKQGQWIRPPSHIEQHLTMTPLGRRGACDLKA